MATENVKLGVCNVTFDAVDLGLTKGGVEVEVTTETHKVMVDQFGNVPVNEYIVAREVKIRVPMAETTLENLIKIMPGATLVTDGTTPTKKKVNVEHGTGINLLSLAKQLILHPAALTALDKSQDFTVPLAMTAGALTYSYKLDEERIYNVEFAAYPNSTTDIMFIVGDPSAVA